MTKRQIMQTRGDQDDLQRRALSIRLDSGGRPSTLDEEARSVEVVAATESPVMMRDPETWERLEIIDAQGRSLGGALELTTIAVW